MTEQEFNEKMIKVEQDYETAKKNLYIEYAASMRVCQVGDIISDGITILLVEKFSTSVSFGKPTPVYVGKELKKDLTVKVKNPTDRIFGNREVKIIKQKN